MRTETLKEKVYSTLKTRILNFELKPGERLSENEVAGNLGVSRTPVREALTRLEQEGLIRASKGKGYAVSDVTEKEIEQLYEIREALEVLAIRAAAKNARPEDWSNLERMLRQQGGRKTSFSEESGSRLFVESHRFHDELARLSGNITLQQMLSSIMNKIMRLEWMNVFFADRARSSLAEHQTIVAMLKRGEIEEAIEANSNHIRRSKENILKLLNRKKDIFYIG